MSIICGFTVLDDVAKVVAFLFSIEIHYTLKIDHEILAFFWNIVQNMTPNAVCVVYVNFLVQYHQCYSIFESFEAFLERWVLSRAVDFSEQIFLGQLSDVFVQAKYFRSRSAPRAYTETPKNLGNCKISYKNDINHSILRCK